MRKGTLRLSLRPAVQELVANESDAEWLLPELLTLSKEADAYEHLLLDTDGGIDKAARVLAAAAQVLSAMSKFKTMKRLPREATSEFVRILLIAGVQKAIEYAGTVMPLQKVQLDGGADNRV